jgi:hypothetical protein
LSWLKILPLLLILMRTHTLDSARNSPKIQGGTEFTELPWLKHFPAQQSLNKVYGQPMLVNEMAKGASFSARHQHVLARSAVTGGAFIIRSFCGVATMTRSRAGRPSG